ncbi:hypothetical protein B0H65DRAFT_565352 [Neurospora tetraspora]|uniref:Uncharacterized protein n=1 Tax=Neurospora tetraspora TaxID=94610 RepID=A0AAE0JR22_9PEZI|nr:hypothetical protein B0H65DRAFT_565352 [Neurospora tetraspora]
MAAHYCFDGYIKMNKVIVAVGDLRGLTTDLVFKVLILASPEHTPKTPALYRHAWDQALRRIRLTRHQQHCIRPSGVHVLALLGLDFLFFSRFPHSVVLYHSNTAKVCSISNIQETQEQEDQPATVRSQFLACRRTSAASLLGHERKAARGNQQQHEASLVPTPDSYWASIFDISRPTLLATLACRPISFRVSGPTTPPLCKVCFPIASLRGTSC